LEPLPATEAALAEMVGEPDLREVLLAMGRDAQRIVPSCVGLSLGFVQDDLTFTLVATSAEVAGLDATQYLDGGPCVEATALDRTVDVDIPDLLDEQAWSLYARATAAAGIASSLSLPLRDDDGTVIGGINLYAAHAGAFRDHHAELAVALGAGAEGAVADADLGFRTRTAAERTPATLAQLRDVEVAIGLLAAHWEIPIAAAHERLEDAARRAGITPPEAARVLVWLRRGGV